MKRITREEKIDYMKELMDTNTFSQSLIEAWIDNDREKAIESLKKRMENFVMNDQEIEITKDFIMFVMEVYVNSIDKKYFDGFKEISTRLEEDEEFIEKVSELGENLYEID